MSSDRFRFFVPIIAGATLKDRLIACLGALLGIGLTAFVCALLSGFDSSLPIIVAPMGASAVLLFAVPASPLAQPWPIIGGNVLSALVGITVARIVEEPALAAGLGVSLAILLMSFTRCLHPPGGAAALTAVLGGQAVADMGFLFPFVPVALNSILLVAAGYGFHRLSGRTYPHVPAPATVNTHGTSDLPAQERAGIRREDIDGALEALGESFDIDRGDLDRLLREAEMRSLLRSGPDLTCAAIMSRDIIHVHTDSQAEEARSLLLRHNIRTLPVIDETGRLAGAVGLRDLSAAGGSVAGVMASPATAAPDDPAIGLLPALTDGSTHGVVIVDAERRVVGLVTQTDLLATLALTRGHGAKGEALPLRRTSKAA